MSSRITRRPRSLSVSWMTGDATRQAVADAVRALAEASEVLCIPAVRLGSARRIRDHRRRRTPRISRRSAEHGASRSCSARAPFTSRTPRKNGSRSGNCGGQSKSINGSCAICSESKTSIYATQIEVGVLGATGMVGQHFVKFLQNHPWFELDVGGRERPLGRKEVSRSDDLAARRRHAGGHRRSRRCRHASPTNAPKLVFSATDASVATEIEQAFAAAGHVVVSNSRNHRMEADVPLLVPEINYDHLKLIPRQQRERGWKGRSSRIRTAPPS